jgi:DNA-binding MarR family transcriptional regulator
MAFRPSPFDVVEASRRVWAERWGDDAASGNAVFTAILRSYQMLNHRINEVMNSYGLTFVRYEVLSWLAIEPDYALTLSWISEVLRIPPATVTNLIDRLETDGLVRRVPHPTDARTTLAEITDEGRQVAAAAAHDLMVNVYGPLELDADQREQVIDLLATLRANAAEFDVDRSPDLIRKLDERRHS